MAGTAKTVTVTSAAESDVYVTRVEFNKLVDDLELVRSKLVAHGAVAHAVVADCDAADLTAAKVNAL